MYKLNFKELILLSKVLKKMGLKENLTDFIFGSKFDEMLKTMDCDIEDKQNMIFINIATFFIENIYLSESEVFDLFSMIEGRPKEDIEKYTIDEIIPIVIKIMSGSFPEAIGKIIILNMEHFKKKILSIVKIMNIVQKSQEKKV